MRRFVVFILIPIVLIACSEFLEAPALKATVSADTSALSVPWTAGAEVIYHIHVSNTGNVDLVAVSLDSVGLESSHSERFLPMTIDIVFDSADRGSPEGSLKTAETAFYTARYSLTEADIAAGAVSFQVTARASSAQGNTVIDISDNGDDDDGNSEDDATVVGLPELPDLAEGQWHQFKPAGDTRCSDGSDYSYYVYPGSVNKLVVDFIGGGACWNYDTCVADPTFSQSIDEETFLEELEVGIYDHKDLRNPFKDWFHVVVPYCTGDVHWGDATTRYTNPDNQAEVSAIQHRGAVNARAVLNWVYDAFEAPRDIFVTGCSAGAYGSALWASHINLHYTEANLYQLGDSAAGIASHRFINESSSRWNITAALPVLGDNRIELGSVRLLESLYLAAANFFPNSTFSQYNTTRDAIQIGFYALMKGEGFPSDETIEEWIDGMPASQQRIAAATSNFYYVIDDYDDEPLFPDTVHCIINRPGFYQTSVAGTTLISWLEDMVTGQEIETISVLDQ